jgi:hypothetical protein
LKDQYGSCWAKYKALEKVSDVDSCAVVVVTQQLCQHHSSSVQKLGARRDRTLMPSRASMDQLNHSIQSPLLRSITSSGLVLQHRARDSFATRFALMPQKLTINCVEFCEWRREPQHSTMTVRAEEQNRFLFMFQRIYICTIARRSPAFVYNVGLSFLFSWFLSSIFNAKTASRSKPILLFQIL